ncbi:hypothetical protein BJ742DRAFT_84625 [Cladochytrium replicatum]|nr:hypothetical protein BJ742DRAFT_84625 [Cladochytrium replicatum]
MPAPCTSQISHFFLQTGPDAHGSERITLRDWELRFRGSVLHLRGSGSPTSQPCLIRAPHLDASMQGPVSSTITNSVEGIHGAETNVRDGLGWLLFNGEIFDGVKVQQSENDTQALEKEIAAAISHPKTRDQCTAGILDVFSRIRGEWATIIWEQRFSRLWLGRDVLGRRSLVWNIPSVLSSFATVENDSIGSLDDAPPLAVSSAIGLECSDGQYGVWEEVPADGLYCIDFGNTKNIHTQVKLTKSS